MKKIFDALFVRKKHICPWWLCFTFDNYFRTLIHDPDKILRPYVRENDTVLDIGPGMGYFTIPLARMVGANGKVIAADIQKEMLDALHRRAQKAGVDKKILLHLSTPQSLGINEIIDFALAFWMIHEVPDSRDLLKEIHSILRPGGLFLMTEPSLHVSKAMYMESMRMAEKAGFTIKEGLKISLSRSALFIKNS